MMALLRDLGATDPGLLWTIGFILGAAWVVLLFGLGLAVDARKQRPRRESMSERHYRLDAEAAARTRPTSSNRKAGRSS